MTLAAKGTKVIEVELDGKKAPYIIAFKGDDLHAGSGTFEVHSQVGVLNEEQTGYDYYPDPTSFFSVSDLSTILDPNIKMLDNYGREFSCFDTFQQLAKLLDMVWTQSVRHDGTFAPGSTGVHGVTGCVCYTGMHDDGECLFYTGMNGETGIVG